MTREVLLSAGAVAVGVYAVGDLLCGVLHDGYSFRDQAISELSARGSPVRALMVAVVTTHGLLLGGLGVGVWLAADRNRALRWTAASLIASVLAALPLHPFFPMSSRWLETGSNDRMHIVLTVVFSILVAAAVALSAAAIPGWFRIYSLASLAVIAAFALLAGSASRGLAVHRATPWMGAFERVNAYTYFAWIVVLALVLIRRSGTDRRRLPPVTRRGVPTVTAASRGATAGR